MAAVIRVEGLRKRFGALEVLRGIDCAIEASEVVCVIGPSGSGKSTFLRCLNGLEDASGGTVRVGEVSVHDARTDLDALRADIGMVFQRFNLFPHKTVLDNITLAPRVLGRLTRSAPTPTSSRAASSSAWRLPARWPCSRASCSSTSRPRRSIRRWWARCSP